MEEQEQAEESLLPKSRINLMMEARMKHKGTCKLEAVEFFRFLGYLNLSNATRFIVSILVRTRDPQFKTAMHNSRPFHGFGQSLSSHSV